MEVFDYFDPVDFSQFTDLENSVGKFSLGNNIGAFTTNLSVSNISRANVVIFGVPADNGKVETGAALAPGLIRKELYRLAALNSKMNIADLGDLKPASGRKGTFLALRDVVEYLNELGVAIVVIGGSQDLTTGICEAFKNNRFFSLTAVDAILDVKKGVETFHSGNYLTRIFKQLPNLFGFSLVGYQNHLVGEKLINKIPGIAEHLRLGMLRSNFLLAEPVMRNSDVLSFDMGALKFSEAPGTSQQNPNGLRGEEACQLSRYAGSSDRLKVFGLFGTAPENDVQGTTIKLAAEIIWYFLEGCVTRKGCADFNKENKIVYKVEIDEMDQPLVFFHEPETNRWWFEINSMAGETAHFACSEDDYKVASSNEIPGKWLDYIQKMDGISK
ncbi:MAG: arginase family protein [Tangfeifania sp.]